MFPTPQDDPFTTSKTRRNFIKYSISENDWMTQSGASIMRSLQEGGIGIRKTDFLEIRREKLDEIERKEGFLQLGPDQLIPYHMMNMDTNITLTNAAQYRLRLTVQDPESKELSYVYRSIGSDDHYTPGEIEQFASSLFSMGGEGYEFNIVETTLHDVWLTPGAKLTG